MHRKGTYMSTILKGAPVVAAMNEANAARCAALREKGVVPTLAVVRVGERPDDLSYEKGVMTRCAKVGVEVKQFLLPADASQEELLRVIAGINADAAIHGCLLFRPLPKQFDDRTIRAALSPEKDIDGITDGSLAGVFTNTAVGYPPCTAQACLEILKFYNIPLSGKRAVVVGRSLVVGKPAAMMLDRENATVTLCNSRTQNLPDVCREADVVVVAMGKMGFIGAEHLRTGQVVVDVGIHVNEEGRLCGDVRFGEAEPVVEAITPVPGGVGTVTTSVLVEPCGGGGRESCIIITSPSRLRRATARLRLPASASALGAGLASCWPRPQQLLPVSAAGGGRRCCSQRERLWHIGISLYTKAPGGYPPGAFGIDRTMTGE